MSIGSRTHIGRHTGRRGVGGRIMAAYRPRIQYCPSGIDELEGRGAGVEKHLESAIGRRCATKTLRHTAVRAHKRLNAMPTTAQTYYENNAATMKPVRDAMPDVVRGFRTLHLETMKAGTLGVAEKELIALAIGLVLWPGVGALIADRGRTLTAGTVRETLAPSILKRNGTSSMAHTSAAPRPIIPTMKSLVGSSVESAWMESKCPAC